MPRRYKVALFIFAISLIGIMLLANKLRGDFGIGSEVIIPVLGIFGWLFYDSKNIPVPKPRENNTFRVIK